MVRDYLFLFCGTVAALLSPMFGLMSFVSVVAFYTCVWRLKGEGRRLWGETEAGLRKEIEDLQASNSSSSEILSSVFARCSDFFTVYQDGAVQLASKSLCTGLRPRADFWTAYLHSECAEDFQHGVARVLAGEDSVSMRARFVHAEEVSGKAILPLSPILDAVVESCRDRSFEVQMDKIAWKGKPAALIHVNPQHAEAPVHNFIKTFNHEFRTPLNIIIGLSDLILSEREITKRTLDQRQRLLRQCACTLLATVTSIIHQCELEWKIPTGLQHLAFTPKREVLEAVQTVKGKMMRRGNGVDYAVHYSVPNVLWGNVAQFRHVVAFLLQTCSEMTSDDEILLEISAESEGGKCIIKGEISAGKQANCSQQEFDSVLHMFETTAETEMSEDPLSLPSSTDRQCLLRLSVAREMCRLFFGDLRLVDKPHLSLHFSMSFSVREHFVLKRKGNIYEDGEEFVPVKSPSYTKLIAVDSVLETEEDEESDGEILRFKSEADVSRLTRTAESLSNETRRRVRTLPSGKNEWPQPPLCLGDRDELVSLPDDPLDDAFALIVEDVPSVAVVLQSLLKRLGLRSAIVNNGQEALSFLDRLIPDVIFMDCEMPVMGGLEATRHIRKMKLEVPVIAVTANGPEREGECLAAGMDCFISKPVTIKTLAAVLQKLNLK